MVAVGDLDETVCPRRELPGAAEGVVAALHDERGQAGAEELLGAGPLRLPRRVEREAQGEDGAGAELVPGPAGDPGAGAAAARDHGQAGLGEGRPESAPAGVEGLRRGRDLLAGDPPGLLDEGRGHAVGRQRVGQGLEVAGLDPAAGAVAEGEHGPRLRAGVPGDAGLTGVRGNGLVLCHVPILPSEAPRPGARRSRTLPRAPDPTGTPGARAPALALRRSCSGARAADTRASGARAAGPRASGPRAAGPLRTACPPPGPPAPSGARGRCYGRC